MRTIGLVGLLVAAGLAALSNPARADTIQLRIGAGHPQAAIWIATLREYFMPQVAERAARAGHTVQWTEAWGGSVCKLGECLEAVESGLLDIADIEAAFEPAKLIAHNFTYFVPFGAADPVVAQKAVAETYEKTPALAKILRDDYSQVPIGFGVVGNYGLLTNFEWKDVKELNGHKIAAAGPNLPWLQGTGVVGVQSTLNEAYTSFQTGVYEGWIMFPDSVLSFKLNEVTKQYTPLNFGVQHTPLVTVNKDVWDKLPPDMRTILTEVGKEWGRKVAEATRDATTAASKKLTDSGFKVIADNPAASAAWAKSLPNIPKTRAKEIDGKGQPGSAIYSYVDALKAAGVQLPRDWSAEK